MDTKDEMLRSAGFRYNFDRMAYVNRTAKKMISVEAVEDHSEDWLGQVIDETNDSEDWLFYFEEPPSKAEKQEILAALG